MFREMRRKKRALTDEAAMEILKNATSGVLALCGDGDYPYAVPVSYALCEDALYIHGAMKGHKFDAVAKNEKASFCVIDKDEVVPEELATNYRSVICFGKIHLVTEDEEKEKGLLKICEKYSPGNTELWEKEIKSEWKATAVFRFDIEHFTGKAR